MDRSDTQRTLLLAILDQAFSGKAWHGTTLRGALRGVTPELALWRPGAGRPRIWDYLLHCAWWKHEVRRRIAGAGVGPFPRRPSNWPAVPAQATLAAWRADIRLLEDEQRALRDLAQRLPSGSMNRRATRGGWRHIEQLHGVAAHDCYHTGQIQLVKRLAATARRS